MPTVDRNSLERVDEQPDGKALTWPRTTIKTQTRPLGTNGMGWAAIVVCERGVGPRFVVLLVMERGSVPVSLKLFSNASGQTMPVPIFRLQFKRGSGGQGYAEAILVAAEFQRLVDAHAVLSGRLGSSPFVFGADDKAVIIEMWRAALETGPHPLDSSVTPG
ncbi:MAG TPA: hypothetical protein VI756_14955 [Blastocatellia bacterium]